MIVGSFLLWRSDSLKLCAILLRSRGSRSFTRAVLPFVRTFPPFARGLMGFMRGPLVRAGPSLLRVISSVCARLNRIYALTLCVPAGPSLLRVISSVCARFLSFCARLNGIYARTLWVCAGSGLLRAHFFRLCARLKGYLRETCSSWRLVKLINFFSSHRKKRLSFKGAFSSIFPMQASSYIAFPFQPLVQTAVCKNDKKPVV